MNELKFAGRFSKTERLHPEYQVCYSCKQFWENDSGIGGYLVCPNCDSYLLRVDADIHKKLEKIAEKSRHLYPQT